MTLARITSRHRIATLGALGAGALLATAAIPVAATATGTSGSLSPVLECVRDDGSGAYTAFWGYNSTYQQPVTRAIGSGNKFTPAPENRGQPTTFPPGRSYGVFSVPFTGSNLVWTLSGKTATASANPVQRCKSVDLAKTLLVNGQAAGAGATAKPGDVVSYRVEVAVTTPIDPAAWPPEGNPYTGPIQSRDQNGGYPVLNAGSIDVEDPNLGGDLPITAFRLTTSAVASGGPITPAGQLPAAITADTKLYRGDVLSWTSAGRAVTAADCGTAIPANTATVDLVSKPFDALARTTPAVTVSCELPAPPTPVTPPVSTAPAPPVSSVATPPSPAVANAAARPAATPTRARLAVDKRGPQRAVAGQVVTYRITVTNTARAAARGVVLTDTVPAQMSLVRRQAGVRLQNGRLRWSLGTIAAGQSTTVTVQMRLDTDSAGTRCNTAQATAANAGRASDRACTIVAPIAQTVQPAVTG